MSTSVASPETGVSSALAVYGPISLVAFVLVTIGLPIFIWLKVGRKENGETPVVPVDSR